jgi:hypothetical protein
MRRCSIPGRMLAVGATTAMLLLAASGSAGAAVAGRTQDLHGVVRIDFPDFVKTSGHGCKADTVGSVARLQPGNRVWVHRGVRKSAGTKALAVKRVIAAGRVARGTFDAATDSCEVAFRVKGVPVLPDDEFYVVEVQGISTTQTVSAPRVTDGDLGAIPAEL